MKYVLVTGAKGFIGGHLCKFLLDSGVRLKKHVRNIDPFDDCEQYACDLEISEFSLEALNGIDIVYHLAGVAHDVGDPVMQEKKYRSVNIDATIKLATLAVKKKVKNFVFVSSVKAGGSSVNWQNIKEEKLGNPDGIYGITKREAEIKLLEIGRKSDMHVSIVRPSLVYGPDVRGNLKLMLSGVSKGWFPSLPEIGNRRSMVHVDDLVRALLLVTDHKRANGEIFIATDGETYSSREIYKTMCGVLGKSVPRWSVPNFIFNIIAKINTGMKYKVNKLLGDEYYSSEKLQSIGFKAERSLKEMNETSF